MKKATGGKELPASKLRWRCPEDIFKFKTTDEIKPCKDIIGQERAILSISMGLELEHRGYNIFITGLVGTGRTTTIKHLLERLEKKAPVPPDMCYMHNFKDPGQPVWIELDAGSGKKLADDMDKLIANLKKEISSVFRSDYYKDRRKRLLTIVQNKQKKIVTEFEDMIGKEGLTMVRMQAGAFMKPEIVPVVDGNPTPFQQLAQLVDEGKYPKKDFDSLVKKAEKNAEKMAQVYEELTELENEFHRMVEKLDAETVKPIVHAMIMEIDKRYRNEKLSGILVKAEEQLMKMLDMFRSKEENNNSKEEIAVIGQSVESEDPFLEFRVNVIVDNSDCKAPPVIIENFPNQKNLFGVIERHVSPSGWANVNHMDIRTGSFQRANGGYLVLNALDVLTEPGVWNILKRTLKSSESIIQSYDAFSLIGSSALKPEPIYIKVKIVLIGDARLYYLLQAYDEDFRKIFKIRADFDREIDRSMPLIKQYAGFIKNLGDRENLKGFDRGGVAAVVEAGVRLAGRQNKLSTRFSEIADLVREADYHSKSDGSSTVSREHVEKARKYRIKRVSMYEEKIRERITEGTLMIDTKGEVVGQVNALSVYNLGDYSFGMPSRITARTALGNAGVINIEREADMSGSTHNKGVLILGGYLRGKYGGDSPLVMSTSLCFEQSYGGVDGDSASSTELYAILSSLSGLPIRQDIAVTGSINQNGEVQPIGGVNEKIEGFFKVCKARGFNKSEGVIIPVQNVSDLMLDGEVVEAVKEGRFHIYPIKSVDEGISLLTGVKAGKKTRNGKYPAGSVNDLVQKRLIELALKWKKFGREKGDR